MENDFQNTWKFENAICDEREVPSYVDNDLDWWYKRRTCAGMNHYLITRRERRISRDGAFDEPIGRKKIGILARRCVATANRAFHRDAAGVDYRQPTIINRCRVRFSVPRRAARCKTRRPRAGAYHQLFPAGRAARISARIIRVCCASRSRWVRLSDFGPETRGANEGRKGSKTRNESSRAMVRN